MKAILKYPMYKIMQLIAVNRVNRITDVFMVLELHRFYQPIILDQ